MIKLVRFGIAALSGAVLAMGCLGCSDGADSSSSASTTSTTATAAKSKATVAADYIDALNAAKAGPPPGKGMLAADPDSQGFLKSVGPMPVLAGFSDAQRLEMGKASCAALIRGVSSSRVEAITIDALGNTGLVATSKLMLCPQVL